MLSLPAPGNVTGIATQIRGPSSIEHIDTGAARKTTQIQLVLRSGHTDLLSRKVAGSDRIQSGPLFVGQIRIFTRCLSYLGGHQLMPHIVGVQCTGCHTDSGSFHGGHTDSGSHGF